MQRKIGLFLVLLLIPLVYAETSYNFLTMGLADTLYCRQNGNCNLSNLNVVNTTVTNQNITGIVNAYGYNINGTPLTPFNSSNYNNITVSNASYVKKSGDIMTGNLNITNIFESVLEISPTSLSSYDGPDNNFIFNINGLTTYLSQLYLSGYGGLVFKNQETLTELGYWTGDGLTVHKNIIIDNNITALRYFGNGTNITNVNADTVDGLHASQLGNTSWNESYANTLYLMPIDTRNFNTTGNITTKNILVNSNISVQNNIKIYNDSTYAYLRANTGGLVIQNDNVQLASANGKNQFIATYNPTTGTSASTKGNYFEAYIGVNNTTPGTANHVGNEFYANLQSETGTNFNTLNMVGTNFVNVINGNSGAGFQGAWAGSFTGVNFLVNYTGSFQTVAGFNAIPITELIDFNGITSASHQVVGHQLIVNYNKGQTPNQLRGFSAGVILNNESMTVAGTVNAYYGSIALMDGAKMTSGASVYMANIGNFGLYLNRSIAVGKRLAFFSTQAVEAGYTFMTDRETDGFYTELASHPNNYAFKSESAQSYFRNTTVNGTLNFTGNIFASDNAFNFDGTTHNLNISGNINQVNGNTTINNIYGEMWNRTSGTITTGFETIDLVTVDVYVLAKKLNCGNNNGFTCTNGTGNLTAQVSGMYQINVASSVNEGAVTTYGMKLFINNIGQNNCYNHFHTSATSSGNPTISCLARINAGSNISIGFDDHTNPVTDLILSSMNVNLWRIGN